MKCRVCGCTDHETCFPPCGWAAKSLCTTRHEAALAAAEWMERARRLNKRALMREAERLFGAMRPNVVLTEKGKNLLEGRAE